MGFLEDRDLADVPSIPEFYKGKTIFITGGSGFIGKVLLEKLLYSCPELDRIYLLIRPKKNVNSEDRLEQLFSKACFDRLRKEKPGLFESKVFVVAGDVMQPGLGLSQEDRALLINRVNILFHIAASVRFDDTLKFSIQMNLRGTVEVIELGKEIKDLCALVHVSTSYSNTNRDTIEEVLYPPLADWRETLAVCESIDEHTLRTLTPKYLGEMPNTYTFSKQLAEHVVYENKGQLPIVIVRPSIVVTEEEYNSPPPLLPVGIVKDDADFGGNLEVSCVIASDKEPMPGWVENFNGPVGIFVACGKGILRTIHTKPEIVCDFIPVDVCVKNIAAAAWIRGTKKLEPTDDIAIYNCCAGNLHPILMKDLIDMSKSVGEKAPLNGMLWHFGGKVTSNVYLHYIKVLLQHLLPALFVDAVLWLFGKKPMLIKIQRRVYTADLALRYYTTKQWIFDNTNFLSLRSSLKGNDRESFWYDIENIDFTDYFVNSCLGARKYLFKEEDDLTNAKIHCRRMKILDKTVQIIFYSLLAYWLFNILQTYSLKF